MRAYVVDTETTGAEPVPEVMELAVIGCYGNPYEGGLTSATIFQGRFKPSGQINFGALAVHHILPHDVTNCPASALARAHLPTDMTYMIGHQVDYDWEALGKPPCKRVCTLAMARAIWPELDSHTLSALSYALSGDLQKTRQRLIAGAHMAEADALLCLELLEHIYQHAGKRMETLEELWQFSEFCRIPTVWGFGKHKGKKIAETDSGYLRWCIKEVEMDPYVKEACRKALVPKPLA